MFRRARESYRGMRQRCVTQRGSIDSVPCITKSTVCEAALVIYRRAMPQPIAFQALI